MVNFTVGPVQSSEEEMISLFRKLLLLSYNVLLAPLPSVGLINKLKIFVLRRCGVRIGEGCYIEDHVRLALDFRGGGGVILGDRVWLCRNVFLQASAGKIMIGNDVEVNYGTLLSANGGATLTIEENCHIAHFCSLKCSTMEISSTPVKEDCIVDRNAFKDICVGRGTWMGASAVIIPGVRIGAYNVIAAGAVVTKDSPAGVLLAGVPAVVKKCYLKDGERHDTSTL